MSRNFFGVKSCKGYFALEGKPVEETCQWLDKNQRDMGLGGLNRGKKKKNKAIELIQQSKQVACGDTNSRKSQ